MALWANLHLGFILGLLLIAGYVGAELLEPSEGAFVRLRRAWPWLVASVPATLVNPYGYWVYVAVHDQLAAPWARTIEWQPLPVLSLARAPFPVLLMYAPVVIVLAVVGGIAIAALRQRRWGAAAWLGAAALATFQNRRFVELPGIVAALVAPAVLKERFRVPVFAAAVLAGGAVFWGAVPGYPPPLEMAAGLGTAVPVEAMDFLEREDLPGRIYDYNSGYGSYLVWRLFPKYQDSFDSRLIPFGASGFGHAEPRPAIATSAALYEWAARNQVNMILLSMVVPPVPQLCGAADWSLVYRDTKAAIMLRRWAATEKFIRRLQIC